MNTGTPQGAHHAEHNTQHYTELAIARLEEAQVCALLPEMVRGWVSLMGMGPTLALVRARPGMQLKVPVGVRDGKTARWLCELLGDAAAQAFMGRHGGEHLVVPRCSHLELTLRNAEICAAYDAGESLHAIGVAHNLSLRQLRNVLNNPAAAERSARDARGRLLRLGDGNPGQADIFGGWDGDAAT